MEVTLHFVNAAKKPARLNFVQQARAASKRWPLSFAAECVIVLLKPPFRLIGAAVTYGYLPNGLSGMRLKVSAPKITTAHFTTRMALRYDGWMHLATSNAQPKSYTPPDPLVTAYLSNVYGDGITVCDVAPLVNNCCDLVFGFDAFARGMLR